MKFAKIGPYIGWSLAGLTLTGTIVSGAYAVALGLGLVTNEARAQEIVQTAVDKEEAARLMFQREMKFKQLRYLNNLSEKSPDDQLEMENLRDEIKDINDRLKELEN